MHKRILVLDDNQDILDIVGEVLVYEGYEVKCIGKKADFEMLVDTWKPDIVLLDFLLADGNGGEICRNMKSNNQTRQIPMILFSAYFNKKEDFDGYGCDGVIIKPFDLQILIASVKKVCN